MMTRFRVQNYKCLKDVDIPLTPIHVLIGENDTGKTSLLEAMEALFRSTRVEPVEYFTGDWSGRELVNNQNVEPEIKLTAFVAGSTDFEYSISMRFGSGKDCKVMEENINGRLYNPSTNSTIVRAFKKGMRDVNESMVNYFQHHLGTVQKYRFDPSVLGVTMAPKQSDDFGLASDGFGLNRLLDKILGYDHRLFGKLESEFVALFPQFLRIRLEETIGLSREFRKKGVETWHQAGMSKSIHLVMQDGAIRFQQASDGVKLFLAILAICHSPNPPRLLLIEEPENGIYPKRLEQFIQRLKQFVTDKGDDAPQIIMTTHSPFVLSMFEPEDVTFMSRRPDGTVRARPLRDAPDIRERLGSEFYLGELWYNLSEEELFGDNRPTIASGS